MGRIIPYIMENDGEMTGKKVIIWLVVDLPL